MVNEISLTARLKGELETMKTYRDAVKNSRRFSAKNQRFSPVMSKILTHEETLEKIKKLAEDSEIRRKRNDEIQALLASFRTRRADIKPRPVQKNQVVVNVPAGSSVVLVFN